MLAHSTPSAGGRTCGSGQTSQPTTQPTSTQPIASAVEPDAPLGTWNLEAFEGRFDVEFSAENLSETSDIAYGADLGALDSPFMLNFIVDPDGAIVGTGIRSRLPHDRTATEDEWLAFIAETRPDAAEWLTSERDAYLVAPGEEVTRAQSFGGLCAGLVTGSSVIEPASEATYLYMWLGYEQDCP